MIEITTAAYNQLTKDLIRWHKQKDPWYPWIYLLSGNIPTRITKVTKLGNRTQGIETRCYMMRGVSTKPLIKAVLKVMKKGRLALGIARIGNFHPGGDWHHDVGNAQSQLKYMSNNAIFLSISHDEGFNIEIAHKEQHYKIINVK